MKEVELNNLPKWSSGPNKGKINWDNSIGHKVPFKYNNINGEIKIIGLKREGKSVQLEIEFENRKASIERGNFTSGHIGALWDINTKDFKYNIGDLIVGKFSTIEILEPIRERQSDKSYRYICHSCWQEGIKKEVQIKKGVGCSVCSGKKVVPGINDIYTTNPYLASMLLNPNDGFANMQSSGNKVDFKCPNCGEIINDKTLNNICRRGRLSCPRCGDGISYPQKIMYSVLKQLGIEFICEFKFECDNSKRYDFYFEYDGQSYIVEVHGIQHYEETTRGKGLKYEQDNDKEKEKFAYIEDVDRNKEAIDNYIVIDCRYSELDWIKKNISKSKLANVFDLEKIDWNECQLYSTKSLVFEAWDLWNSGTSVLDISKEIKVAKATVIRYLNRGNKLGMCRYIGKEEMSKGSKRSSSAEIQKKKVYCVTLDKEYDSISEASRCTGAETYRISGCCNKKKGFKSAGFSKDGYRLIWMYAEDFHALSDIEKKKLNRNKIKKQAKQVICLEDGKVYESGGKAEKAYGLKKDRVNACCRGDVKHAGGLHFEFYDEFNKRKSNV
ncbi:hypothetical protein [Clostridium sp. SM-530-WT-3G]|uniref:hypothetical protein n=1 Tax=Clostridium sp. SM-530-WT-3G TaxID=2725303 RepID=UPI00145E0B08|nr:hypothetical protein [Clostridium sp. SM-530-WT-3G]NME84197.1 hypothetical protein [Clostridium sp. SM-530-WT-3G]